MFPLQEINHGLTSEMFHPLIQPDELKISTMESFHSDFEKYEITPGDNISDPMISILKDTYNFMDAVEAAEKNLQAALGSYGPGVMSFAVKQFGCLFFQSHALELSEAYHSVFQSLIFKYFQDIYQYPFQDIFSEIEKRGETEKYETSLVIKNLVKPICEAKKYEFYQAFKDGKIRSSRCPLPRGSRGQPSYISCLKRENLLRAKLDAVSLAKTYLAEYGQVADFQKQIEAIAGKFLKDNPLWTPICPIRQKLWWDRMISYVT